MHSQEAHFSAQEPFASAVGGSLARDGGEEFNIHRSVVVPAAALKCGCGTEFFEDDSFCRYCGSKRPEPPVDKAAVAEPVRQVAAEVAQPKAQQAAFHQGSA